MPIAYRFRCQCSPGGELRSDQPQVLCPGCGNPLTHFGMAQVPEHGADDSFRRQTGYKMETESPARYKAWFDSDSVQQRLRTGELEIPRKSDDVRHM